MSDEKFETLKSNVIRRMSASHTSNSTEDELANAMIETVSDICVELLKEYEKLKD